MINNIKLMRGILKEILSIIGKIIINITPPHPPRLVVNKICVIIWGGIGDGVLFFPSLIGIKDKFKGKKIYSIVQRKELIPLFKDYCEVIHRDGFENSDLKGYFLILRHLKLIKPDMVISNAPNPEFLSGFIPYLAGAKFRLGSSETGRGFLLNIPLKNPKGSDIKRNIDLIGKINVNVDNVFLDVNFKKNDWKDDCFKICIHPGSGKGMKYKRWGKEKFLRLINLLLDNFCVVLIGTEEEKEEIDYILENVKESKNFKVFFGTKDIIELISLISNVQMVITNDSLISHISSMLKKPVIVIFGPSDDERYKPFSPYSLILKKDLICRPCNRKEPPRCKDIRCLKEISVEEVYEKTISLYHILHTHK